MSARDPRQREYERRSRQRREIRAAAAFNGWVDLGVLAAFTDPDTGAFMLFDTDGTRYLSNDSALPVPALAQAEIVAPADRPADTFGPRWQKARQGMADALADGGLLDLSVQGHDSALSAAETVAASVLRLVQVLRENNGPDWREAIGFTEDKA